MNPLKTGPWKLTDLNQVQKINKTVFSCFHCGGGSTMGYKLAGFDVLGGVEIDPEMMAVYKANHNPKHSYLMGVQEFNRIPDSKLPNELFNLDILDGSPPCSSFSMAGSREKAWGENKKFREGQAYQVLDDLFFDFINTAHKLKPKIVLAENVKGLIMGKAKGYVKQIAKKFDEAGYDMQLFLLNAAFMGVPQRRERTFFIGRRKDLKLPILKLKFDEATISIEQAIIGTTNKDAKKLSPSVLSYWPDVRMGGNFSEVTGGKLFSWRKADPKNPSSTVTATNCLTHWSEPRHLSPSEVIRIQTFPDDYNSLDLDQMYICGMSVPPFMTQRIADQIYKQLLS